MGLEGEDGEPHVERGQEDEGAQAGLEGLAGVAAGEELLEEEERQGEHGEDEPGIEVQEQILEVEGPWLGAVEVRAAGLGENVVIDNVPRDDLELFVEKGVDGRVDSLDNLSKSRLKKGARTNVPL